MAGRVNRKNLVTVVSVTVLVATEILAAALALGWALGGMFELTPTWRGVLVGLFLLVGAYVAARFFQHAQRMEPIRER